MALLGPVTHAQVSVSFSEIATALVASFVEEFIGLLNG